MQNRAMREYAARRRWANALQVRDMNSGAARREAREKLLEAARRRGIDLVLVWRLERWSRSVTDLLATLQELEHLGVGFVSLTEALDLTTPAGRAMAGLLAIVAEFEREILRGLLSDSRFSSTGFYRSRPPSTTNLQLRSGRPRPEIGRVNAAFEACLWGSRSRVRGNSDIVLMIHRASRGTA
jgi:Resolvase, N terminal domain